MKILTATLEHLEPLTHLFDAYRVFYRKDSDVEGARSFLRERIQNGDSEIYLTQDSTTSIYTGFVQLYPLYSSTRMCRLWLLNDLYIKPEFRGRGISKLLIAQSKKLAQKTNAAGIMLETEKSNQIGNQLYPATDFEIDEDHNYYFWTNK